MRRVIEGRTAAGDAAVKQIAAGGSGADVPAVADATASGAVVAAAGSDAAESTTGSTGAKAVPLRHALALSAPDSVSLFAPDAVLGGQKVKDLLDVTTIPIPDTSDSEGDHDVDHLEGYFADIVGRRIADALDREFGNEDAIASKIDTILERIEEQELRTVRRYADEDAALATIAQKAKQMLESGEADIAISAAISAANRERAQQAKQLTPGAPDAAPQIGAGSADGKAAQPTVPQQLRALATAIREQQQQQQQATAPAGSSARKGRGRKGKQQQVSAADASAGEDTAAPASELKAPAGAASAAAAADAAGMALPEYFPLFRQDQLLHLSRAMLLVRRDALQRRSVRISEARVHHDDYDEEALEDMRELENEDAMLVHFAFEVLSNVVRAHRTLYLPVYSGLIAQIVRDMCHPEVLPQDRRLAVFLYDDLLEYCGEEAVDLLTGRHIAEEALPVLLRCAREENEHVRQGSVYGLGVAAENCPVASAAYLGSIFEELNYAVEHPIATRDTVEDTAVAAIGKYVMRIYPAAAAGALPASAAIPPRSDVVTAFLLGLPCVHDRVEARTAVSILCALLTAVDADVVGTPDAVDLSRATHALHVLAVSFADPLTNTDDLTATMYGALATLKEKLPGEVLGALWGNLAADDQKALQVLMAGAGKPGSAAALAAGGAGTA